MQGKRLSIPLFFLLLSLIFSCHALPVQPREVRDLHYGEVLFHFYQQDYFSAITHLMMASQQQQLPHHLQESELLLGGMQLSYGMLDEAEQGFRKLLGPEDDPETANRAWFYLAKIAYQRGLYDRAKTALQDAGQPDDPGKQAELLLLTANTHMALGQNNEAAEALKGARAPQDLQQYLLINRGIALLRAGQIDEGRQVLDRLGSQVGGNEELRSLRDRANLGLGYELLRSGEAEAARSYLERVRLRGPYMRAALLGAGWADAELNHYQDALTPWLELIKHSSFDAPVQEAQLAVPYAFAKLGDNRRAVHFYQAAITHYDEEQRALEDASVAIESGTMLAMLNQVDNSSTGGWLHSIPELEGIPAGRYLIDILSANSFQETLKDYRDLGFLDKLLARWQENITLYYEMVDARRQAYQQRAPLIRTSLEQDRAGALAEQWSTYQDALAELEAADDPVGLASSKEQQQWRKLQRIGETIASLPDSTPRLQKLQERSKWLQGILYWQIQDDYKARLWNVRKQLSGLESDIAEAVRRHQQVSEALEDVKAGFSGYEQRIETLRQRILALQPKIRLARAAAASDIRQMALNELETRRQRLISYRSQARYALARTYDQLAHSGESLP